MARLRGWSPISERAVRRYITTLSRINIWACSTRSRIGFHLSIRLTKYSQQNNILTDCVTKSDPCFDPFRRNASDFDGLKSAF